MTEINEISKYRYLPLIKVVFFRVLAAFFLIAALNYWLLIVGFYEEEGLQFDTMETHWRIASAVLSVLMPIVALGLWGIYAWGPALWLIAILIELVMYGVYPALFGSKFTLVTFHLICVCVYLVMLALEKNKKGGSTEAA